MTDLSAPFQVGIIDSNKIDNSDNNYVSSPHFYIDHTSYRGDTPSGSVDYNSNNDGILSTTSTSDSGLSTGAKVGIGIGVGLGIPVIAAFIAYLCLLCMARMY